MDRTIQHNPDRSRYELILDGEIAGIADYRTRSDDVLVFPHTEMAPDLRGQGLGDELVRGALDHVRESGQRIVPQCWFVAQFIRQHREYTDLLAA